jgi:hypothetical protein
VLREIPFSLGWFSTQRWDIVMSSSVKSVRTSALFAFVATVAVVASALIGTNVASADQVQVQSYQRVSESEACAAQPGETPWQASWGADPSWSPSWEQWANNDTGGWVCSRSITWARTPVAASGGGSVTYRVGEVGPGGGTVFYVDMARAAGSQFWEVGSDLGTPLWGCYGTDILGTGTSIGTGQNNTSLINAGCATADIAGRVASATVGGYSDWFLPSKDELNQLCKYARTQSTAVADQTVACDATGALRAGFASANYWSSSQNDSYVAGILDFDDGSQNYVDKVYHLQVRPIRAF